MFLKVSPVVCILHVYEFLDGTNMHVCLWSVFVLVCVVLLKKVLFYYCLFICLRGFFFGGGGVAGLELFILGEGVST